MGLNPQPDGTLKADPFDLLGVVKDTSTGRYHMTLWLEHPLPSQGWANENSTGPIRLKSKLHHTAGAETFEGALEHLRELRKKLAIDDVCVWDSPDLCFARNFVEDGFASVLMMGNWRKDPPTPAAPPEPEPPSRYDLLIEDA